jgi:hypothetical protein
MRSYSGGSAVLIFIFLLTLFSVSLYVFLQASAQHLTVAMMRYTQEKEQQISHGLFLYGAAYAKQHYHTLMPNNTIIVTDMQWFDYAQSKPQITLTKKKNHMLVESILTLVDRTIKEEGIVQLTNSKWAITEWKMVVE